jgi:hypothetical protein
MMKQQDQWIILIVIFLAALHLGILVFGYKTPRLAFLIPLLNLLFSFSLLLYWVQKQFRITQHHFEWRETNILGFELLVIGFAFYALMSKTEHHWLRLLHYVFGMLHFLCLLAFLVFLLTFKMKKLI